MKGVGGQLMANGAAEQRAKIAGHWAQEGGMGVNGWRQGEGADCGQIRAKMKVVATQWALGGNEWIIETHQAHWVSRADTGRPDAVTNGRTNTLFFLLMFVVLILGQFFEGLVAAVCSILM